MIYNYINKGLPMNKSLHQAILESLNKDLWAEPEPRPPTPPIQYGSEDYIYGQDSDQFPPGMGGLGWHQYINPWTGQPVWYYGKPIRPTAPSPYLPAPGRDWSPIQGQGGRPGGSSDPSGGGGIFQWNPPAGWKPPRGRPLLPRSPFNFQNRPKR